MTTTTESDRTGARLESKVDALTSVVEVLTVTVRETNRETNRRIDRLFYLGAVTGAGIIAALLLQPLIATIGG